MAKFGIGNQAAVGRTTRRKPTLTAAEASAMKAYVAPQLPQIIDAVVAKAKKGDLAAARLIMDRVWCVPNAMSEELQAQIDDIRQAFSERDRAVVNQ